MDHGLSQSDSIRKRPLLLFALAGSALLALIVAWIGLRGSTQARFLGEVHIALPAFPSSALVILAEKEGFFQAEGLAPRLSFLPTGRDCLELMLDGGADFSVVYETPVIRAALKGEPIALLTELHRSEGSTTVLFRKDRGISKVQDLEGRKIAVVNGTNAEFLLDLLLRTHLVPKDSASVLPQRVGEPLAALESGQVDAAAYWEPFVSELVSREPSLYGKFRSSFYSEFSTLAVSRDSLASLQPKIPAVLRAIVRAYALQQQEPERARSIVSDALRAQGVQSDANAWQTIDLQIGLSTTLLTMLHEEARWYGEGKPSSRAMVRNLLEPRFMREVAPAEVTFE